MKRTIKTDFKCSRGNLDKLFACNRISAMVYNKVLDLQKEYRKGHNGEWIHKFKLYELLKQKYPISLRSVRAVVDKYDAARLATKSARDKGLSNQYPWRYKHAYPTTWTTGGFQLRGNKLNLSLAIVNHKKQASIVVTLPKSTLETLKNKQIKQITAIWGTIV